MSAYGEILDGEIEDMMRKTLRTVATLGMALGLMLAYTAPASATIHEIVASFCAATHETGSPTGHLHDPPGLTPEAFGGTSAADNVAQPLLSSGAFTFGVADGSEIVEFGPDTTPGDTLLLLDEEQPQVKLEGTGLFFYDGATDVYVEIGAPGDFAAFTHCPNLPSGP